MDRITTIKKIFEKVENWTVYLADYLKLPPQKNQKFRVLKLKNGVRINVRPRIDIGIVNEVCLHEVYNKPGFEVRNGDLVVDIGAHIGTFSLLAAKNAAKVYSFEPYPPNFKVFEQNINENSCRNIIAINAAVTKENGHMDLNIATDSSGGHSIFWGAERDKIKVTTINFWEFIEKNGVNQIDLLKIDCEGGEYDILLNSERRDIRRIAKICMEFHDIDEKRNHKTLVEFLDRNGFEVNVSPPFIYAKNKIEKDYTLK
jgi:FkbM family methyltransferase